MAHRFTALIATTLLALGLGLVATSPARATPSRATVKSRIDSALRGIGASHVDYRFDVAGVGTISRHPNVKTAPASNEKLITSTAALHLLGPSYRFRTVVSSTAPIVDHTVHGNLVLHAYGDPTLTFGTLLTMARSLHARHLRHVTGHLIVDDTLFSHTTRVSGWKHKFVPEESGTVDAFSLDQNEWRGGASFERDPTPANAAVWRKELKRAHITIAKRTIIEAAPAHTHHLLTHHSASLSAIIEDMLTNSVNFDAEMLLREIGAVTAGRGTPATGIAAIKSVARQLELPLGTVHDGSGLSYSDRESPTILVDWLKRITGAAYYGTVYYGLPLSCSAGTLAYRMCGPNVKDRVRAKTGTLDHVSTLSGYFETKHGHDVTFSVMVSGFSDSQYNRIYNHVDAAIAEVVKTG